MNLLAKQLTLFSILVLSALNVTAGQSSSINHASNALPLIEVTGLGKVMAKPDQAELVLRFSETQFKLEEARAQIDEQVKALLKLLKRFEISESSLDSSQVSIQPRYDYRQNNQRNFIGYQVTRMVSFKLVALEELDQLIKDISAKQISGLDTIRFTHSDPESLKAEALTLAIENSKALAQQIAETYEREIDRVHQVSYHASGPSQPAPRMMAMEAAVDSQGSSYQQKDLRFEARVQASFLMK